MNSVTESVQQTAQQSRLFFVLSGEHDSLPAAEVRAILESAGMTFQNVKRSYRLLTLESSPSGLKSVSERSLMYDSCGFELGRCAADEKEIQRFVKDLPLERLTQHATSFAVRSVRLGGVNKPMRRTQLEKDVGSIVKALAPRLNVRLRDPDMTFTCILFDDLFLLGLSSYSKPSGMIAPRLPRKRPVFHPSTMPPKIARCMVNLARATPGATFADPFSGVGGILIEAAVIGCRVLGVDANLRMLRGAEKNIMYFGLDSLGFLWADARHIPLQPLDAIATDPPYGRGSSTMGNKMTKLVEDFLSGVKSSLKRNVHLCISAPVEVEVEDYARDAGLMVREKHIAKVHRSLTRQFVVIQNA
jgi:tRNA (guanine10-N2)-dimethyltransferase